MNILRMMLQISVLFIVYGCSFSSNKTHQFSYESNSCLSNAHMASDKPNITQAWSGDELVVKVVEVEACGLLIKNSNAVVDGNRLNLKYEYYSNGSVMKCFCEYSTEFRFRSLPIKIYDIDFASSYGRSLFEKFMDFCIKFK